MKTSTPITAEALLERFVEMYGEIALPLAAIQDDPNLWRDYYDYSGNHMILTDEGWEPGEAKQSYIDEGHAGEIIDEVNTPK